MYYQLYMQINELCFLFGIYAAASNVSWLIPTNILMKKTFAKFVSAAVVVWALVQSTQAAPIAGTIGFTGRVQLDSGSSSTANSVVGWVNPTVNGASGDFTSLVGSAVVIKSPWNFNTAASTPGITDFWKVGGFSFELTSSSITAQGGAAGTSGFVNVSGIGIVRSANFSDTTIVWNFSTQDPKIVGQNGNPDTFTFSVSQVTAGQLSVPDGALTVTLLGFALTGVGLFRKKLNA